MSVEVLYNCIYGYFGFSEEFGKRYYEETLFNPTSQTLDDIKRTDPVAVQLVKEMGGDVAGGLFCHIEIASIPKKYETAIRIYKYDGRESVCVDYTVYWLQQFLKATPNEFLQLQDEARMDQNLQINNLATNPEQLAHQSL